MRGIQHLVVFKHVVTVLAEFPYDLFEKLSVRADGKAPDVLEYEVRRLQLDHEADEVVNERVSGVVERAFADHAEALARRTAEKNVHRTVADARMVADILAVDLGDAAADGRAVAVDLGDAAADGRAVGEIKLVRRAVDRVVFDCRRHVERSICCATNSDPPASVNTNRQVPCTAAAYIMAEPRLVFGFSVAAAAVVAVCDFIDARMRRRTSGA